jgi:hypothetical protein
VGETVSVPAPPDGATLDSGDSGVPPPPDGATIDPPPGASVHANYDPTEGMSTTDKVRSGIGKGMVDTARGVYQLGASIGHAAGMVSDEKMKEIQGDVDESHNLDKPLMNTTAGKVGDIVGTAAPALLVPGAGILGGAAAGAAMGAAQPVPTGESRMQNAALGAAGGAAGGAVGKVLKAFGGFGVPMGRQSAVDTLTSEGIPLSVAQKTAAKGAQTIERASGMISDAQNDFMAQQAPAFNRAVLKRVGVTDPEVTAATPDVLSGAKSKITGVMNDVAKKGVNVDDEMMNGLGDVEQNASRLLPDSDMGPVQAHLNDILSNAAKNNGSLDGTAYQKIRSSLGDLSADLRYAPIAHNMQDVLDDALTRSSPEDAARLATARQQYRALKQIEPAVDSNGNVSVPRLMTSLMNKSNRNQSLYGSGDQSLVTLAKAARQIIPDTLGNSGTPERMIGPLTVMETARSGEPWKAALKAAGAVYGGGVLGRGMRSQGVVGDVLASGVPGLRAAGPAANEVGPALGYGAAESKERDSDQAPIERASGGKVDHEALVEKLMKRWKDAKKATDKTTKPMLNLPDNVIAKALEISGRAI